MLNKNVMLLRRAFKAGSKVTKELLVDLFKRFYSKPRKVKELDRTHPVNNLKGVWQCCAQDISFFDVTKMQACWKDNKKS